MTLQAADQKQAIASAERYLYARKDHTLAERHDDAGEGFQVVITAVVPIGRMAREQAQGNTR